MEAKDLVQRAAQGSGDAEGDFERRGVFVGFNGVNGLAGDADLIGKLLLRESALLLAELADLIGDRHG
jgi:hypothetical protein